MMLLKALLCVVLLGHTRNNVLGVTPSSINRHLQAGDTPATTATTPASGDTTGEFASLRRRLHSLESRRLSELRALLRAKDVHVQGFYHIARRLPEWMEVYTEQLNLLDGYHRDVIYTDSEPKPLGVMDIAEKLNIFEMTFEDAKPEARPAKAAPTANADVSAADVVSRVHPSYEARVELRHFPSIDRNDYL
jgi:hypothetical protein